MASNKRPIIIDKIKELVVEEELQPTPGDRVQDIKAGPVPQCRVCSFGFHKLVETLAFEAQKPTEIVLAIKEKFPFLSSRAEITKDMVVSHIAHDPNRLLVYKNAIETRKSLESEKKSVEELMGKAMQIIDLGMSLADDITPEMLMSLPVKDRFLIADKMSNTLLKTVDTTLKAKKVAIEEMKFLDEIGDAAARSSKMLKEIK